ncbi:hypothetical protein M8Z33_00435 [Streptomyces sp. ZAF1911]|uniref:hypothetical protein n=1 Tax=Streptomyces sp. ZAF1911 TaxID=2944129 RepID=UPI00237B7606|nr:hypothetical protein [Streptomyces sp. ZAF1911]MDD9375158.1 hypothetical protein [Streptomyces sp. ZAF1911]
MNDASNWPTDKLTALRLGRRLVAEVPAIRSDRRAFVDITPKQTSRDSEARKHGWVPSEADRNFRIEHWEYDSELIEGFDYDIGAVLIASAEATSESELAAVLTDWQLNPRRFVYPWDSEDPK